MKILVILPNYIGDVLMTTPAIRLIKENNPESEIFAITNKEISDVIKNNPHIKRIFTRPLQPSIAQRIELLSEIKKTVPRKFDYAFVFRNTIFNQLLARSSAQKVYFVNEKSEDSYKDICLKTVKTAFGDISCLRKHEMMIFLSESDETKAQKFLEAHNLSGGFVVLNPVASRPAKMWNLKNYPVLINKIHSKLGLKSILIGGQQDFHINKMIQEQVPEECIVTPSNFSLLENAALIKYSKLFISPDTGPFHISIALNKNTIGLFGSTDPKKYGPYPANCKIIYHKVKCSPCYKKICPLKKGKNQCMEQILIEEVFSAIEKFNIA